MGVGLGTGRAAEAFIRRLARAVREDGLTVYCATTSDRSAMLLAELDVPTFAPGTFPIDVAFDGADEVAPDGSLTKGLGGAMLRERIVEYEAARFVVLVTPEKLVSRLGARCPLPVEISRYALDTAPKHVGKWCETKVVLRRSGSAPFVTDSGNFILDLSSPGPQGWPDPRELDARVRAVPGVIDTGFFFDRASLVLVGEPDGVREIVPPRPR